MALKAYEADVLTHAREILTKQGENWMSKDTDEVFVSAYAQVAEEAIFNYFNVADSYGHDPEAKKVLQRKETNGG